MTLKLMPLDGVTRASKTPLADMLARSPVVNLQLVRDVALTERADAGDVRAMREWLAKFGGPEFQNLA
jgi:hypothetical protein